jgi:hypothetical protein
MPDLREVVKEYHSLQNNRRHGDGLHNGGRPTTSLWTVVRSFEVIRGTLDPVAQSEILTKAQIQLTALILDLRPAGGHQTRPGPLQKAGLDEIVTFAA